MSLAVGARVGPYEILGSLGAGGMGEVYRARDPRLDRAVAIKIVTASRDISPAQTERFLREARAIGRISHPHICTLHDVGQQDDVPFLVMELLEGPTLAERIEQGPVPVGEALRIAVQIARALDGAHRSGVIHRDLKPSNVMLTASGVKLLDFGLAKLREVDPDEIASALTKSLWQSVDGTVLGTLPYMAPEQVEGHAADARTDIFAVGVVLFEMLTGDTPFKGDSRASLTAAILTHAPPPITSLVSAASPGLNRIVEQCLKKNPEERWQSARDLATALEWSAESGGGEGTAATATAVKKRRLPAMAIAMVATAAATAAVTLWARGGWTAMFSSRAAVPSFHQVTYRRGAVSSARFTPDGQSFVYSASWNGQPWNIYLGRAQSPDARNLGVDGARILSISSGGDMAILFGPQTIARAFGTRTLARIPMAGGARRDLLGGVVDADWIPATDSMAVVRDPGGGRPWTVEFPTGTPVHEAPAAWSLRVSPDGNRVAFFEGPAHFSGAPVAMITVIDRSGTKSTLTRNWSGIGLAWTPRGDEIWFTAARPGDNGPQLRAVSLSGVERTVHRAPDWLVLHDIAEDGRALLSRNSIRISMSCKPQGQAGEQDLGWLVASFVSGLSADGSTAAFYDGLSGRTPGGNPTVFLRKLDGSPAVPIGEGSSPKISPDGQWILVTQADNYFLLPTGGSSILKLPKGDLTRVLGAAWLGDSKRIVFAGIPPAEKRARGYIQEIPNGIPRPLTPPAVWLPGSAATIRNEQSVLGLVEGDGRWMLYPLGGGSPQPVPGLTGNDLPVQWSADGRWLYTVGRAENPQPPSLDIFRIELATGRRALWKTLSPHDTAGVEAFPGHYAMTPDAETYCYSYMRRLGDLFVAEGLR